MSRSEQVSVMFFTWGSPKKVAQGTCRCRASSSHDHRSECDYADWPEAGFRGSHASFVRPPASLDAATMVEKLNGWILS
jgi:hypothetical protein